MALRNLASPSILAWGRIQASPILGCQAPSLGALLSRAFATVDSKALYAKSHEWARVDGDIATVGISDFAQAELGDVVYVELPEVGSTVEKGQTFGVVESVKAASDVYAPISGEVVEANDSLSSESGKINTAPFTDGWLIKVKLSDDSQLKDLLDATAYEKHIEH